MTQPPTARAGGLRLGLRANLAQFSLLVDRLIAIIDPHNQPSQRVAENLGLVVARTSDNHGHWSSKRLIYAASL